MESLSCPSSSLLEGGGRVEGARAFELLRGVGQINGFPVGKFVRPLPRRVSEGVRLAAECADWLRLAGLLVVGWVGRGLRVQRVLD